MRAKTATRKLKRQNASENGKMQAKMAKRELKRRNASLNMFRI